jgi:hypothetical protein
MTRLKWKFISIRLKIALILTQDRCTVCVEHTIGSKIILHVVKKLKCNLVSVRSEILLVSLQDRCMVCAEHTTGLEIILDAPNGTAR